MKRFYLIALTVLMLVAVSVGCKTKKQANVPEAIKWNVEASAMGEGELRFGFPTGNISLTGDAQLKITSTNDEVNSVNAVTAEYVIGNPQKYSEEQIRIAKEVQGTFYVDTIRGSWAVDIVGYAKYGSLYFVIDEHFPKQ